MDVLLRGNVNVQQTWDLMHIASMFAAFCLLYIASSSGEILTEEACTQRLQIFNRGKAFKGSPIKAVNLPLAEIKGTSVSFDPRSVEYRKTDGYSAYLRNIWVSHANISSLPISQLYHPANMYAIASDHDYLK